jgi:UDPglucose--hexose-1-phosphate uridylyltransferase
MAEVRRDIVTDAWVIVETERDKMILQTPVAPTEGTCPFCETHERMTPPEIYAIRPPGTARDAPGWRVRVIPSIEPVLRIEGELKHIGVGIHDMVTGVGANEVIVETPMHETKLSNLPSEQIALVLQTYRQRIHDLYQDGRLRYAMIFKNYGKGAGASGVVHSHSELIALPATPRRIKDELDGARNYFAYKERCIFCDIIANEQEAQKRVLMESSNFLVFAPYASRFPYELTIIPRNHSFSYELASDAELANLAEVLKRTLSCLHKTIEDAPYNYILHTAPNLIPRPGHWLTIKDDYHWHIEIIPRVRRVAGFEWGSGFHINPIAPERAIEILGEKL